MTAKIIGDGGPPASGHVEPGDRVQLVTRDGRELEFRVDAVNEDGLVRGQETVRWQDIRSLLVVETDGSQALWMGIAVVASIGAAVLISAAVESAAAATILNCSGC